MAGRYQWLLGAGLAVAGAVCINVGMNVQKKAHLVNDGLPELKQRSYVKQPLWILGFLVFMFGELITFAALPYASQSLLAVLGSFALVSNVFMAPVIVGESTRRSDYVATFVILAGCALVVVFSDHSSQNYTLHELVKLYNHPAFVVFLGLMVGVILACLRQWWIYHVRERLKSTGGALMFAVLGSVAGGIGFLSAKSFAQLIKTTAKGHNQFDHLVSYLIVAVFLLAGVSRVHFINMALRCGHALIVIPTYFVLSTLLTICGGQVYFQEYRNLTVPHMAYCGVGVLLTLWGVWILARNDTVDSMEDLELLQDFADGVAMSHPLLSPPVSPPGSPAVIPFAPYDLTSPEMVQVDSPIGSSPELSPPPIPEGLRRVVSAVPRTASRRYSYHPLQFTGSFTGRPRQASAGGPARGYPPYPEPKPLARQYSVGLLGLGVS